MKFFDTRRAQLRPEFAELYPEIVPGVWMGACKARRVVRRRWARETAKGNCLLDRVLCEIHFEFRGGQIGRQYLTGEYAPRATAWVSLDDLWRGPREAVEVDALAGRAEKVFDISTGQANPRP
jgi:hypothetical protein